MKSKTFLILIVVLCVLGLASYLTLNREKPASEKSLMGEKLFENLPLDAVAAVKITSADGGEVKTVELKKGDSGWGVAERFGYPADFKSISDLVEKFTESKIGRTFEGDPATMARLQLNLPDSQDAEADSKGQRIQLLGADNKPLVDTIVGKQRESSAGQGGQYLKKAGGDTVYLVDQSFRFIDKKPSQWIKTDLIDIKGKEVASVACVSPEDGSAVYETARPEKDKDPELKDPLADRTLKKRSVNSLFDVLSSLKIKDVAGASGEVPDEKTGFNEIPHLEYVLYDGTVYRLYPGKKVEGGDEEGYYLKVEVDYRNPEKKVEASEEAADSPEAEAVETAEVAETDTVAPPEVEILDDGKPEAAPEGGDAESPEPEPTEKEADAEPEINPEELAYEAGQLNEKLSKWTFVVTEWEHKTMVVDPEEFYEEKKAEAESEEKAD